MTAGLDPAAPPVPPPGGGRFELRFAAGDIMVCEPWNGGYVASLGPWHYPFTAEQMRGLVAWTSDHDTEVREWRRLGIWVRTIVAMDGMCYETGGLGVLIPFPGRLRTRNLGRRVGLLLWWEDAAVLQPWEQQLLALLMKVQAASGVPLKGCSAADLRHAEATYGAFPPELRRIMEWGGQTIPWLLFQGLEIGLECLVDNHERSLELLREVPGDLAIPHGGIVFLMGQGYEFMVAVPNASRAGADEILYFSVANASFAKQGGGLMTLIERGLNGFLANRAARDHGSTPGKRRGK